VKPSRMPEHPLPCFDRLRQLDTKEPGIIIAWIVRAPGHIQQVEQTRLAHFAGFVSDHDPLKPTLRILAEGGDAGAFSEGGRFQGGGGELQSHRVPLSRQLVFPP
jgi:hypothetical protein